MSDMLVVDRIEGAFAICEDESLAFRRIALSELPKGLREGDCLRPAGDGYTIDSDETNRRRTLNKQLFERLKRGRE